METVKDLNMDADEMLVVLSALEGVKQTDKGSGTDTQAAVWR
jgi:hypothetical protein